MRRTGTGTPTTIIAAALAWLAGASVALAATEVQELLASDGGAADEFGWAVAVDGDTAIVGARFDDEGGNDAGAVYVYRETGPGAWTETAKLIAGDAAAGASFGLSVDLDGDTAIIGAPVDAAGGALSGAAYVFRRTSPGTWTEIDKLTPGDGAVNDYFGVSVGLSGDTAIIGAVLPFNPADPGAAYVFEETAPGTWTEIQKVLNDPLGSWQFGLSVAIDGGSAVVGAPLPNIVPPGTMVGTAHVLRETAPGTWSIVDTFTGGDVTPPDQFGRSVAISGSKVIVGAPLDDDPGNGVDTGAAYVFDETAPATWTQVQKLVSSDAQPGGDQLGWSVGIDGDTAVV
ncbi:MAG: FG-GAP repeat protein, partial [Planctomycetota bacterium]